MFRTNIMAAAIAAAFAMPGAAFAADDAEIGKIREEIKSMKDDYESRIRALEDRLQKAETEQKTAPASPPVAARAPMPAQSAPASANSFNPAISLILGGKYSNLQRDPDTYQIGGFIPGGDEAGPGSRSFNLGESELTVSANIDPYFSGYFVLAATADNEVEVEEAYVRTPAPSRRHASSSAACFPASAIRTKSTRTPGISSTPRWCTRLSSAASSRKTASRRAGWHRRRSSSRSASKPGRGSEFPGTDRNKNGMNSAMIFTHIGDDVGISSSYRFGGTYRGTKAQERSYDDTDSARQAGDRRLHRRQPDVGTGLRLEMGARRQYGRCAISSSRRNTCIAKKTAH